MNFIISFFKGVAIGAGAILPGISSGVFCVVFGIYEKLLNSILHFFKDIKNNLNFLCPLAIGGFVGIIIFSNFLNYFFVNFPLQTKSIFIGLLLGCIPTLIRNCNSKYPFKFQYLFFAIATFTIGILCVVFENIIGFHSHFETFNWIYLFVSGFIMSVGIVVPGISNTIILMLLGVYPTYLFSVSTLYWPVLISMGIGVFFGSLVFMKLCIDRFICKILSGVVELLIEVL